MIDSPEGPVGPLTTYTTASFSILTEKETTPLDVFVHTAPMSTAERYALYPIEDTEMFDLYHTQGAALWSPSEMDFSEDTHHYEKLPDDLKRVVDLVNAFFSSTDGIIVDNITTNLIRTSKTIEERMFYSAQNYIETVHMETYSLIIQSLVTDESRRREIFGSADTVASVKAKDDWLIHHMNNPEDRATLLLVFACSEGIFFTAAFIFIFYFRTKSLFPTMVFANEQISKDEMLHRDAGITLYRRETPLSNTEAHRIVADAVRLELDFVDEVIPHPLDNGLLDPEDIKNYVRHLADHLLISCGHPPLFNIDVATIPTWMNDISMDQKSNIYELRVGNYKQISLKKPSKDDAVSVYKNPEAVDF